MLKRWLGFNKDECAIIREELAKRAQVPSARN
jgi:hypothetical protein